MTQDILDIMAVGFLCAIIAFVVAVCQHPESDQQELKQARQEHERQVIYRLNDEYVQKNPKLQKLIGRE